MSDILDEAQSVVEDAMHELHELQLRMEVMQAYRLENNFLLVMDEAKQYLTDLQHKLQRAEQIVRRQSDRTNPQVIQ